LALLPDAVDLGGLYRLAESLRKQAVAPPAGGPGGGRSRAGETGGDMDGDLDGEV
jgi:hypothetical protein